jgi:DNA-binding ferritin-like protein
MRLELLQGLLAFLRAVHFSHLSSHWQVQGLPFFGDHRMFIRLYRDMEEEIDTLAEKIVGEFGASAVDPVVQAAKVSALLAELGGMTPVERALVLEERLQVEVKRVYQSCKMQGDMSLGLDDYLMGVANAHEGALYLLRQRGRAMSSAMVQGPSD